MRFFLELAYNGTRFNGYQIQPDAPSVQQHIQEALATLLRRPTPIVGCGRTDTGVHALQYFAHFDAESALSASFLKSMNAILPKDIVIYRILEVGEEAHARFDATSRSYLYQVDTRANPFRQETAYFCPYAHRLDRELMQQAAQLLLEYKEFDPFCKTNTDVQTKICSLTRSEWIFDDKEHQWVYHVTANRFLRGMIRLIVGMCLNVGRGVVQLEEVQQAMEEQKPLKRALSAPACGLFLHDIQYPYSK